MKNLMNNVQRFIHDEEGVTAIEYGLIAALIAVGIIASVTSVRQALIATFTSVANAMTGAAS